MPPDQSASLRDESLEVGAGPVTVRAKGKSLSVHVYIALIVAGLAILGYKHHSQGDEMLQKILEATTENTYVLSLSQADRERLNLAMPDSLRRKLRRQYGDDHPR